MARQFVTASSQYFANTASCPVVNYPFSIACLYKPTADAQDKALVCFSDGTTSRQLLYQNQSNISIFSANGGASAEAKVTTGSPLVTTSWYVVGCTVSGASSRASYLGDMTGNLFVGTDTATATTGQFLRTYIGAYYVSGSTQAGFYANGGISDVAIWNTVLSRADFEKMNNHYAPSTIRRRNLVAYYKLNESGSYERDSVAFRGMTASGTPSVIPSAALVYRRNPRRRLDTTVSAGSGFHARPYYDMIAQSRMGA